MTVSDFRRLFKYEAWANDRIFAYARTTPEPQAEVSRYLGHMFIGQEIWHSRLVNDGRVFETAWVDMSLDEAQARCMKMRAEWTKYLDSVSDEDLSRKVEYVRMGKPCWNYVADVLTHMITHGMYHRGQISIMVRKAGGEPVATDFVAAGREGALD